MPMADAIKNSMQKRDCSGLGYTFDRGRCNDRGLTALGAELLSEMAVRGMVIDVDHMSAISFDEALSLVETCDTLSWPATSGSTKSPWATRIRGQPLGGGTPPDLRRGRPGRHHSWSRQAFRNRH